MKKAGARGLEESTRETAVESHAFGSLRAGSFRKVRGEDGATGPFQFQLHDCSLDFCLIPRAGGSMMERVENGNQSCKYACEGFGS